MRPLRALADLTAAGHRSVGEPHFSVVLAFFNLALAFLLIAAWVMLGFCVVLDPEAAAAASVDPGVKLAFGVLGATAAALTAVQLIPGPPRWRDKRQRMGVLNLCLVWPAVIVAGAIGYLQLPGELGCV